MSALRHALVINPKSRGGALGKQWPELSRVIRRELGSFEELRTEAAGDGARLARQALRAGADRVIAIGGDGTINEVANGFFENGEAINPDAAMGILPFGSGGDFRKTLGIPKDIDLAARRLATGRPRRIDLGVVDYVGHSGESESRIFINIASFGVSGLVDEYVNKSSKRLGGTVAFLVASARASFNYQNQRVRLIFNDDDASAVDTIINTVAIANGRYFGGGMYIAPEAELDDGQFDVVQLGDFSTTDLLRHGHRIYSGTHLILDKVSHRRAPQVRAEPLSNEPVLLDIDGEAPGRLPATFRIMESALQVIVA